MSLLYPDSIATVETGLPRLHALIIGVADYPHLNGGAGPLALDPLGLGQVTTPRHTAKAISRWLLENYANPVQPLGSVEVLLSPEEQIPNRAGLPVDVENADFSKIEDAFQRWVARCSSHKDNIAFFYFCGHGLQKDAQLILPGDFGNPAHINEWRNCIDFDAIRLGMRSCKAKTQLFFVDACRETPHAILGKNNVQGQSLISSSISDPFKISATYFAATEGKQAFGPANDVTYFCKALLNCLNGMGAMKSKGKWVVTTHSLSGALGTVMHHYGERYGQALDCNPNVDGFAAFHEPATGLVVASIECASAAANAAADILLQRNGESYRAAPGDPKPLVTEVPSGEWEISVTFPGGGFPPVPVRKHALMPIMFEEVIP